MTTILLLTKTQPKVGRLKPSAGLQPVAYYWQGQGWVYQYAVGLAVAIMPYRAPSTAQQDTLAVGRQRAGTEPCASWGQHIAGTR
ncbi:hypothetical protein [Janthinobacterium sp. NKUCC06_STL]|uniref:hypothetical protein n=1 Tax=Janthinobacterium sp. NKUCC06_STL TaxID=2842127 RepID=UPI001C5B2196|nr:hypothetical protein [Janthinobacterium sp. NKUCC06_STL]MBW3512074.1 hypothetical protein [Janthinobacterium sp. NKUCC06_STL]